jgi:hypothetical protein
MSSTNATGQTQSSFQFIVDTYQMFTGELKYNVRMGNNNCSSWTIYNKGEIVEVETRVGQETTETFAVAKSQLDLSKEGREDIILIIKNLFEKVIIPMHLELHDDEPGTTPSKGSQIMTYDQGIVHELTHSHTMLNTVSCYATDDTTKRRMAQQISAKKVTPTDFSGSLGKGGKTITPLDLIKNLYTPSPTHRDVPKQQQKIYELKLMRILNAHDDSNTSI